MDRITKKQRHNVMSHIRNKDTMPEKILRKALWSRGIHYRKNCKNLPGTPDIVLTKYKIAIFCDGDFWHGHNFYNIKKRIETNHDFWIKKISNNIERDKMVDGLLLNEGWLVLRFWESDIKKDINGCAEKILEYLP